MTVYFCELCDFVSDHKTNYVRHLATRKHEKNVEIQKKLEKKAENERHHKRHHKRHHSTQKRHHRHHVSPEMNTVEDFPQTYDCKYCGQSYLHRQGRHRHQRECTKNMEIVSTDPSNSAISNTDEQSNQITNMKLTNASLTNTNSHNTTNMSNSHNTTNNITINNYQTPDRSHLTDKDIMRILKQCNSCVPKLVEETYFNEKKPENHSLCIRNLNTKYAYTYNGKQWNATMRDQLVSQLVDLGNVFLENKIYDWSNEDDTKETEAYKNASKSFLRYMNNAEQDHVLNMIKDKITLILYNFRNLPKVN